MAIPLRTLAEGERARQDFASAMKRMRRFHGAQLDDQINSSYRSIAEQRTLFFRNYTVQLFGRGPYGDVRWYNGKRYVRTGPVMVAVPGQSKHNYGLALDIKTSSPLYFAVFKFKSRYGIHFPLKSEPWHAEYVFANDTSRDVVGATQSAIRHKITYLWSVSDKTDLDVILKAAQGEFPKGKKYAQSVVGVTPDGEWGPKSKAATKLRVTAIQTVWKREQYYAGTIDGIVGPKMLTSQKQFNADNG